MPASLRRQVRDRARNRCEYCDLHQDQSQLPHTIDHIRAVKHAGATTLANTCWSCAYCNAAKGSNVAGYDPMTDALVRLYHPRKDSWHEHFKWKGPALVGRTAIGRATIDVLRINGANRVRHRALLLAADK